MGYGLFLCAALAAAPLHAGPGLKEAVALYHRGHYDSALAALEAARPAIAKRRDSLSLFQYSGMASARLGRADLATADFGILLALDSLFQFPRNEDPAILDAFAKAKGPRSGRTGAADAASPEIPPRGGDTIGAARLAYAGNGSGAGLAVGANLPAGGLVPIPSYPGSGSPADGASPFGPGHTGGEPRGSGIGLAMGAIPLGGGWLAEGRYGKGLALAVLQIGGTALSLYASSRITAEEKDLYGIQNERELGTVRRWQWTQGVALSTALGSYLYSLIASGRP
jgi:hypothetical protein